MPNTEPCNVFQIIDHAHAIFGSIPLVQMVQPGAGKTIAAETEFGSGVRHLFAVLDPAQGAGFRFEAAVNPAAGAWFLISCVCTAEAAVHSAGSNQSGFNRL